MKLNKKGMSWEDFIMWLGVLIFCLFALAFMLRKVGILDKDGTIHFSNLKTVDKEEKNNKKEEKKEKTYEELESELIDAGKKYVNDFYNNELNDDTLYVKVKTLIENDYLTSDYIDKNGDNCSGYLSVKKGEQEIEYKAYIKCGDYETEGYLERHES